MLRFVCFFPILQSWAGFLHLLASCLQRLTLSINGNTGRDPDTREGRWVWESTGGAHGPVWGIHGQGIPSSSWKGFLMEPTKKLVGHAHLRCILSPACCAPSLSLDLGHTAHLSILVGRDRSPLGQCPTWLRNQVHTHWLSLSPTGELMYRRGLPWH